MKRAWPILLVLLACASPGARQSLTVDRSLLHLEYMERAPELPTMRIDGESLKGDVYPGMTSPVVWRYRDDKRAREYFRPLPGGVLEDQVFHVLGMTLEKYGFAVRGWTHPPQVRLKVEARKLRIFSRGEEEGSRRCDLDLLFVVEEGPTGLPIREFRSKARVELPGSWTRLRDSEPHWITVPGEVNPVFKAVEEATLAFLQDSRPFWSDSRNWLPSVEFSSWP